MEIRKFQPEDAAATARVITDALRISNAKDYPPEYIEYNIATHTPEVLIQRANEGHMYVVCDGSKIVGCGTIAPYWGSQTESILLTIFVQPEYQGKGVGRLIINTLEQDEYFLRAERVEIPASITGVEFYKKMGYNYKNGVDELEDGVMYRLEKFPKK